MMDTPFRMSLERFSNATDRLREALDVPERSDLVADAIIQRFEFTFELAWKTARRRLHELGIAVHSPREALRKCFAEGFIEEEAVWLRMLEDRNRTSHLYSAEMAREIVARIDAYEKALRALKDRFAAEAAGP